MTTLTSDPTRTADPFVTGSIRRWLRLEALALLVTALVLYARGGHDWGLFAALLLVPDLSLLAYFVGPRAGATAYNLAHSEIGPIALGVASLVAGLPTLAPIALIWLAHVGMDRALGYGLKYPTAFGHTHLGRVGRLSREPQRVAATA